MSVRLISMRIVASLLCALLLCGCSRWPDSYAPPQQFAMPSKPDPLVEVRLITMNHPNAPFSILEGVRNAGYDWGFKWTLDHARFQLIAGDLTKTDFFLRYALDSTTFHTRGPVRITISIDGKPFDSFIEGIVGEHVHRHPAGELTSTGIRTLDVSLTVDPPWIAGDGARIGIFLDAIGFVPRS